MIRSPRHKVVIPEKFEPLRPLQRAFEDFIRRNKPVKKSWNSHDSDYTVKGGLEKRLFHQCGAGEGIRTLEAQRATGSQIRRLTWLGYPGIVIIGRRCRYRFIWILLLIDLFNKALIHKPTKDIIIPNNPGKSIAITNITFRKYMFNIASKMRSPVNVNRGLIRYFIRYSTPIDGPKTHDISCKISLLLLYFSPI